MELIDRQDAIDIIEKYFNKITLNPDICTDGLRSLPTVDAIPVEFIQKRIDFLDKLAKYEFEATGGYGGQAAASKYELKNLLKDWKAEQEVRNDTIDNSRTDGD